MVGYVGGASASGCAEGLLFLSVLEGNADNFVSLVNPCDVVTDDGLGKDGTVSLVFPKGGAGFVIEENVLIRKPEDEHVLALVLYALERGYRGFQQYLDRVLAGIL